MRKSVQKIKSFITCTFRVRLRLAETILITTLLICAVGIGISLSLTLGAKSSARRSSLRLQAQVLQTYGKLPLSFEANAGQTDRQAKFLARASGYTLFLTRDELVLAFNSGQREAGTRRHGDKGRILPAPSRNTALRMKLPGANPAPKVTGEEELPGKVHYFIGNQPGKWRTNIPTYAKVKYEDVYPGIDLVYYGTQRQLEYDFVVAPGVDPKTIRLAFDSPSRAAGRLLPQIDEAGDLLIPISNTEIRQQKPLIYQKVDGVRREISGGYVLKENHEVGFQIAAYDASKPLVIDPVLPVLLYSTYLGGSSDDRGLAIAVDSSGAAYMTGITDSANFPTVNPFQPAKNAGGDAFVTKLNSTGSALVFSTYLGGGGSGNDVGFGIAVDSSGNAYVTGRTDATDFPTVNPLQPALAGGRDAFVAKLNSAGSGLVYSTYLGGTGGSPDDEDNGHGIAVDSSGSAYVTGRTSSTNFPTVLPAQATYGGVADAFVAKLNPAGSALAYSTYLGGNNTDVAEGIAVDNLGNAYVTGVTASTNFPTANAFQASLNGFGDAFVTKLNSTGSTFVYSTYLGGSFSERGEGIAVDSSGSAYVTGTTQSTNFPTAAPIQATSGGGELDAFVTKLNPAGSGLVYSTYLGGAGVEAGRGIAVDNSGNAYVTGVTRSANFPTVNPVQAALRGFEDAFVTKLNSAGSGLVYSTYLGGSDFVSFSSDFDEGLGIAVDPSGNAYVTGLTNSTNFPVFNPLQPNHGGGGFDAFVAKIAEMEVQIVTIDIRPGTFPNTINLGSNGTVPVAIFSTTTFDATTVNPTTVTLASASVRLRGNGTPMASFSDVNNDGLLDLLVHVSTEALQLTDTDMEAVLEGRTFDGQPIRGVDTIRVLP